jgi:hypothetical protein
MPPAKALVEHRAHNSRILRGESREAEKASSPLHVTLIKGRAAQHFKWAPLMVWPMSVD